MGAGRGLPPWSSRGNIIYFYYQILHSGSFLVLNMGTATVRKLASKQALGMVWYGIVEFNVPLDTV